MTLLDSYSRTTELRLPAPAKLNLMLRVVGRRDDGYHLLQTVFQFLDCCDWITLRLRGDNQVSHLTPLSGVPVDSDLTIRAARLLQQYAGVQLGVDIAINKTLPMGGGLGGGSSNAATVLHGLNILWDLGFSANELMDLGLKLGADVPIFIYGENAWAEGVGDVLTPLDLPESWYVIVIPPCHVATQDIFTFPELTRDSKKIRITDFMAGDCINDCLPVVKLLYPLVGQAMDDLNALVDNARLTGTGACVYAEVTDYGVACGVVEHLRMRWRALVAKGCKMSLLKQELALN